MPLGVIENHWERVLTARLDPLSRFYAERPRAAASPTSTPSITMSVQYAHPPGPPGPPQLEVPKAHQACATCKRQKRKCDKALPACALCVRMNRPCDYSDAPPLPTAEDITALRQQMREMEQQLAEQNRAIQASGIAMHPTPPYTAASSSGMGDEGMGSNANAFIPQEEAYQAPQNRFPAIAFLDSHVFESGGISVPKAAVQIPGEVLAMLGDGNAVQTIITEYFATIHTWFPIISKKRMSQNMVNPLWEAGPDLALLFLCMKLHVSRLAEGESSQTDMYMAAKRFLSLMEAGGVISPLVLQAMLMLTVYEIGQAIYPAAWMSVGMCSRYGQLLGINEPPGSSHLIGRPVSYPLLIIEPVLHSNHCAGYNLYAPYVPLCA
jgi:hypothetical protein